MRTVVVAALTALATAALFTVFVASRSPEEAPVDRYADLEGRLDAIERALAVREAEEATRLAGRADAAELRIQGQAASIEALQTRLGDMESQVTALDAAARARTEVAAVAEPRAASGAHEPATKEEVGGWLEKLRSDNENIAFSATQELRRLKDKTAAPALMGVLKDHHDYYVRLGAATALGDLQALEAVPSLIEALDAEEALVRSAANEALAKITGGEVALPSSAGADERRAAQDAWWTWWNENEARLRAR